MNPGFLKAERQYETNVRNVNNLLEYSQAQYDMVSYISEIETVLNPKKLQSCELLIMTLINANCKHIYPRGAGLPIQYDYIKVEITY